MKYVVSMIGGRPLHVVAEWCQDKDGALYFGKLIPKPDGESEPFTQMMVAAGQWEFVHQVQLVEGTEHTARGTDAL